MPKREAGSIRKHVYDSIIEDIVTVAVEPGDILNEKALVEKYEVSKSPVREALIQLTSEGILKSIPRYGYEVIGLTSRDIEEMLEYRSVIECEYMRKYGANLRPVQIDHLEELNKNCDINQTSAWEHWQYNVKFHLYLMQCYDVPYVYSNLEDAMNRLKIAYGQLYWNLKDYKYSDDTKNHKVIIEALKKGDVGAAADALANDLRDFNGKNN